MQLAANRLSRVFLIFGMYALVYIAAIVFGLLIFFKGRAHVRKKYGLK